MEKTTREPNEAFANTVKIVGGLALAAFALGAALLEIGRIGDEAEEKQKPKRVPQTKPSEAIADAMRDLSVLQQDGQSLIDFMLVRYNALAVLGEHNHTLKGEEMDSVCRELGHFHKQCYDFEHKNDADQALAGWYLTSGQSSEVLFTKTLSNTEVGERLKGREHLIAYALGASA